VSRLVTSGDARSTRDDELDVEDVDAPSTFRIVLTPTLAVLPHELVVRAITGGGPGGQHVNRSATRVEVRWNVRRSASVTDEQRARLVAQLGGRLSDDGTLRVVAGEHRSQQQNRRAAVERLRVLVARSLAVAKSRTATKPTRGSVERRHEGKRQQAKRKAGRRFRADDAGE
jgi:ribosome-associated protein